MTIIDKIKDLLRMLAENIHKRRRVVLALSCVVVFVTTYMLILPAFTLEKTKAAEQGGIDVPGVTATTEDTSSDTGTGNDDSVIVENKDNESDGQKNDTASSSDSSSAGKTESNNSNTTESKTDTTTKEKVETITEKEAMAIAMKAKANSAGVIEEEVEVSSAPATGRRMLKAANRGALLGASRDTEGVWDLTDGSKTQFIHVSAEPSVTETEQERDAAFKLTFTYGIKEEVVKAIDEYDQPFSLVYDLNSLIDQSPIGSIRNNINGVISIGSRKLGTYTVQDGIVTLHFTDTSYFDKRTAFTGYFNLTVETSETELGLNDEYTYSFPGTTDTVPIHYKKVVQDGNKTFNKKQNPDGSYTLSYTADVNVNSDLDSMRFEDTLGGLQTLNASSVKINGTPVTVSTTQNGFSFDVAAALETQGIAKGNYKVTYDTTVTEEQLKQMEGDKTTETNTAKWIVHGDKEVPGGSTTIEIDKPREPIPVTKTISSTSNQPGDTVNYTVTYGKDTTALSGFHISDLMTDVVVPQGKVTLNYNGETREIDFGSQATDNTYSKGTVSLFDYTFPEGTPGNGPVTVSYSVKLIDADTAAENGIYDTTSVSNTAQEHRQNTTDTKQTTVTYKKEPTYTVKKTETSNKDESGNWTPGTDIHYTLTIGDADTNMAGVNIKDVMTDLQILQGDVMIKVGNGNQVKLSDYVSDAMKWSDDNKYSTNDVELFNFNMPSDAGNGPVVITYTTKVISQEQADANGIFGTPTIRNTGHGGKQSDGTSGTGVFDSYPIEKTVKQNNADVNGQTVEMGSTVHYTLTFGKPGMNMAGKVIEDYMTDMQKLVGDITVKKADGTSFIMPSGTGQWSEDGNNWTFWDDEKYSNSNICLFKYKLPNDIGEGPITVEYDTKIITEQEANDSGIQGTQHIHNRFTLDGHPSETDVKVEYPSDPKHEPKIQKDFDHWDVENNKVYWTITVDKTDDSAFPLQNIKVTEKADGGIYITEKNVSEWHNHPIDDFKLFDVINAVVTTDDGTILTPGQDYTIDKETATFTFPVLNERVHINYAFKSPIKIVDGYYMHNRARVIYENDWTHKDDEADQTYNNPGITVVKNGSYDENSKIVEWKVSINSSKKDFADSDPVRVWFEDQIPEGLTLLNAQDKSENNPSLQVKYAGDLYLEPFYVAANVDGTNKIINTDIAAHGYNGNPNLHAGLNKNKIIVTYYTKLSDAEWNRITSSASGSETFNNNVTVTAGNDNQFEATDTVTVTSDGYINKTDTTKETGGIVVDPDSNENSKNITYSVEINPNGYQLNNGNVLQLTDYISTNMDLDATSVQIVNAEKGDDGKLHPKDGAPAGLEVSYNDDSRLLSIRKIPDNTPLLLTYTCIARAQGQDSFDNTATLIGGGSHSASTHVTHTIQTNDAGVSVDGLFMSIQKIDENNITQTLGGAKFQLYECELAIGDLTNPDTYNQQYWNQLLAKMDEITAGGGTPEEIAQFKRDFKITNYRPIGEPVETGSNGFTQWEGLSEHKLYAWVEVESPDGYVSNGDYHYFVGYQHMDVNTEDASQTKPLPAEEQLNRKNAAWALDDACQLANNIRVASMANLTTWTATNVESQFTSISATKEWEGDSDNYYQTRPEGGIKLQLWRIDANGNKEKYGNPVAINVGDDGSWPTYIWNKLPSHDAQGREYKYTVVEEKVENYSTSYSDNGEGQTSGEIVVTNKMIPKSTNIHVKKEFNIDNGEDIPESIKVTLFVIKTDKEGNVGEPEETSYETYLSDSNNWSWTFEKLPTTDDQGNTLSYTAVEDTAALERAGFQYTVSYSDNGQGVIETTEEKPLTITNAKTKGSVKVTKEFSNIPFDKIDATRFKITARWFENDEEKTAELTLLGEQPEGVTRRQIGIQSKYEWTIDNLPLDTIVTFEESGFDFEGYSVTVNGAATAAPQTAIAAEEPGTAEFVNDYTKDEKGSLELQKFVKINGFSPTDTTNVPTADRNKADGTYTFNITGTADTATEGVSHEVTITISNGAATEATIDGQTTTLSDGKVVLTELPVGVYTVTEAIPEPNPNNVSCISIISTDGAESENIAERSATVTVNSDSESDTAVALVSFTNSTHSDQDNAHVSVRKTFSGLTNSEIPANFSITVRVADEEITLSRTGDQPSGVTFTESVKDGNIVWEWEIDIPGLTATTNVEVEESNYGVDGFEVTPFVNGQEGTSTSGTVTPSTVVQSLDMNVVTEQDINTFPLTDSETSATIFAARLTDNTALVISKNRLNLSERAAIEAKLQHMSKGGDWTHGNPVSYYSFDEARNSIYVRGSTVTYSDENGGQISFSNEYQWNMVATGTITYQPGRPADFNFANSYIGGVDLTIVKVDKVDPTQKLEGAKFTITMLDEDRTTSARIVYKKDSSNHLVFTRESDPTGEDGTISFEDLKAGYYEIKETQRPEGYIETEDPTFYIHVSGSNAVYLIKSTAEADANKKLNEWTESNTGSGLVTYDKNNKTATVQNEFGTELPMTGGIGTVIFYVLGSILVIGGGIYFISRRRAMK